MKRHRVVIYPKDVQRMTGRSEREARRTIEAVKKKLGKEEHQFVTVYEYSQYSGIPVELVEGFVAEQ